MNHPIVSRHLAEGDPFLALADIFLGMMVLVAIYCLLTGIRARNRNFILLGGFFVGGFINAASNLYFRFWIPTVEPYIGSWITLSAFVLFVESYLDLPGSKARIRVGILFLVFGVTGFVVSVIVTFLEMNSYESIIVVMDILAATLILSLYIFLLFHSAKGSGKARALLAFETIMVVGAVSAMGIFKTSIRGLNGIPDSLIDGNFLFLIGMTVNGFLFVYLLTEELVGMRVRTELDHARMNFVMNVSHELKTPLTIIGGTIHQLKEGRWGDSIKENINHLNVVERNSQKLLKEITNLLHLSDMEDRDWSFQTRATDISNTLEGICRDFRGAVEQCGLHFSVEIAPDLHADTDPVLFENAVLNLLSNAAKYTPPGGRVKLSAVESVEEIRICVSDTGSGIPADEHDKVFQRFYRSLAARKAAETGKGIGLALVKETITRSGGRMELKSNPGIGTRVSLVFPSGTGRAGLVHAEPWAEHSRSEHELQSIPAKHSNAGLVLLVEDNQELITYLRRELDRVFDVASVTNGAEALEWLGSHTPDLIISDVVMPEVNGYELFDRLREDENSVSIPFLFLTARSSAEEKLTALRNGAVDYIEKPFFAEELIAKARSIVATTNEVRSGFQRELKTSIISFIDSFPADRGFNPAADSDLLFAQACRTAKLTPREREISLLLRKGKSDKEIATHLGLSTKTVGNYNTSLFRKLNVAGRMEIVAFGRD